MVTGWTRQLAHGVLLIAALALGLGEGIELDLEIIPALDPTRGVSSG
jgi:hypothetical protein